MIISDHPFIMFAEEKHSSNLKTIKNNKIWFNENFKMISYIFFRCKGNLKLLSIIPVYLWFVHKCKLLELDSFVWFFLKISSLSCQTGCAIYTGKNTKVMLNSKFKANKLSCVERRLNIFNLIFIIILILLTLICLVGSIYFEDNLIYQKHWYLMGREPTFFNVSKIVSFHDGGIRGVDTGVFPRTFLFYLTKKCFKKIF